MKKWVRENRIPVIIEVIILVFTILLVTISYFDYKKDVISIQTEQNDDLYQKLNRLKNSNLNVNRAICLLEESVYMEPSYDPDCRHTAEFFGEDVLFGSKLHKYNFPYAIIYELYDANGNLLFDNGNENFIEFSWEKVSNQEEDWAFAKKEDEYQYDDAVNYDLNVQFSQEQVKEIYNIELKNSKYFYENSEKSFNTYVPNMEDGPITECVKFTGYYEEYQNKKIFTVASVSVWDKKDNKEVEIINEVILNKAEGKLIEKYNVKFANKYRDEIIKNKAEMGRISYFGVEYSGIANHRESDKKSLDIAKKYFETELNNLDINKLSDVTDSSRNPRGNSFYIYNETFADSKDKKNTLISYCAVNLGDKEVGEQSVVGIKAAMCVNVPLCVLKCTFFPAQTLITIILLQLLAMTLIFIASKYNKKTREVQETKSMFLNAIAHEMKTPTAVIVNASECIKEGIHPEKRERYQDIVYDEAGHIAELVNHMLMYTRITDSDYKPIKEHLILNDIVKEICERFSVLTENKKLKIELVEYEKFKLMGDRKLLEMVVDNYISNAVKNCKEHGRIIITIDAAHFRVFNEGAHIPREDIHIIWEPLYKGDDARSRNDGSSGMGLAISAGILKLHGLKYGVENVEGGVEFYIK
ncbi:MAG: HAMP domain-containing histidine kinase [Lachnospiraceae bacterium]|nr:HAMP domain-containing histidine kinase [Lachnospiraceae bacterium]